MTHGIMGISKAFSIVNTADVDECDNLEYLIDDVDTGVIGLYLESIPNGRRFPVVLKGLLRGEIHKTDLGLVRTDISAVEDIESVLLEFQKTMSGKGSLLIQKQVQGYP